MKIEAKSQGIQLIITLDAEEVSQIRHAYYANHSGSREGRELWKQVEDRYTSIGYLVMNHLLEQEKKAT